MKCRTCGTEDNLRIIKGKTYNQCKPCYNSYTDKFRTTEAYRAWRRKPENLTKNRDKMRVKRLMDDPTVKKAQVNSNSARKLVRDRNKRFKNKVLSMSSGCVACGLKDIRYLEFDHIDPTTKKQTIALMVGRAYGIESIKQEMRKCQILCSSCHFTKSQEDRIKYPNYHMNKYRKPRALTNFDFLTLGIVPCL